MKKLFYGLGAVAAVVTPVVAVVSCGSSSESKASVTASYNATAKTLTVTFNGKTKAAELETAIKALNLTDAQAKALVGVDFVNGNTSEKINALFDGTYPAPATAADASTAVLDLAGGFGNWLADCLELA